MQTFIVTKAFQFRGTMWHAGQTIKMSAADANDPFVMAHVRGIVDGESKSQSGYLGNGKEKTQEDTPASVAGEIEAGASKKELRAALAKMGVPCPPNATKEEMEVLFAQAKEAVAGSADKPNKPAVTGM